MRFERELESEPAIAAERACARLCVDFTRYVDTGEYDRVAALFVEDGTFTRRGETFVGQSAISSSFDQVLGARAGRARSPGLRIRHVCTNIAIDVIEDMRAKGLSYYSIYTYAGDALDGPAPVDGPGLIGDYVDEYVKTNTGWRFARREARPVFFKPAK